MKDNSMPNDTLQQVQTGATSAPSMMDDVMRPIERKPMPVRCRGWSRTKAVAACLAVMLCARISAGGEDVTSIWVARSPAIARCKIVQIKEEDSEGLCKVERVIYGKLQEKQIRLCVPYPRLGASRVFFLDTIQPEAEAEVVYIAHYQGPINVGDIQEREREIAEIVERGDHLTPPGLSSYHLGMYIRASSRIVRAKLRKVGTSAAEWKVVEELEFQPLSEADLKAMPCNHLKVVEATAGQGSRDSELPVFTGEPRPTEPGIVRVGLGTWRVRAETVAGFHADRDAKRACTEEEIQKEFDRLVTAELQSGTKAILLLRAPKGADTYNLVGNLFPDPKDPGRLDKAWKALTKTIESGEYRTPQSSR